MDHARLNIHGLREELRDRYLRSEVRRVFSPDAAPWDLVNDTADDRLPFTLSAAWVAPEADDSAPESLPTPHPRPIHDPNPETNATAIDTTTTTLTTSTLTITSVPNPIPAHPQIQEIESFCPPYPCRERITFAPDPNTERRPESIPFDSRCDNPYSSPFPQTSCCNPLPCFSNPYHPYHSDQGNAPPPVSIAHGPFRLPELQNSHFLEWSDPVPIQTQHCQSCTCQTSTPPRYPHDPTPFSNLSMIPPPHAEPSLSSTNPFRSSSSILQDTLYHPLNEGRACGRFRIWQISFAGNPDEDGEEFLEILAECAIGQNLTETEILRAVPFVLNGSARAWAQEQPRKWSNYSEFLRAFRLRYVPNNYQTRSIRPVADHSPPSSPPSPKCRKALPKSDTPPTTLPRPRKTLPGPNTSPTPSISPQNQPLKTNGSAPPRSSSPFHTSN